MHKTVYLINLLNLSVIWKKENSLVIKRLKLIFGDPLSIYKCFNTTLIKENVVKYITYIHYEIYAEKKWKFKLISFPASNELDEETLCLKKKRNMQMMLNDVQCGWLDHI